MAGLRTGRVIREGAEEVAEGVSEATRRTIPQFIRDNARMGALLAGGTVLGATQLDEIERFVTGQATFGELAREDYDAAMSWLDIASNEIADGAEQVATETVQIGWTSFRENIYAGIETIATIFNSMVGGETGLGLINWARRHQNDRPPLVFDRAEGGLVEAEAPADPANTVDPNATVTPDLGQYTSLTEVFQSNAFEQAFIETLELRGDTLDLTSEEGATAAVDHALSLMHTDGDITTREYETFIARVDALERSENLDGILGEFASPARGVDTMIANVNNMITSLSTTMTGHAEMALNREAVAAQPMP